MKIVNNAEIKKYTTYKLEGRVNKIVFPENIDELKTSLKGKYKIIGNGSNLIISEKYDGTLICLKEMKNLSIEDNKVTVEAGYSLPKLVRECAKKGLSGLEFACGIPATVGGAVYMNAGAYGHQMSDVLSSITVLDENLNIKKISNFASNYRTSIVKEKNYICLNAEFILEKKDEETILKEIDQIMESRKSKQPLEYPSAGSVFKNKDEYSAGRLIEKAGLKGLNVNDAEVSLKHANFIINKKAAKAEDVIELINIVKNKIKEKYNIDLELEQEILK